MPKSLRVAGEVDSWCTRCRLVLNHRIVSMKTGKPHQVECLTCRAQHLWRPKAPGDKPTASAEPGRTRPSSPPGHRSRPPKGPTRQVQLWEQAIAGSAVQAFKSYSVAANFSEGDLLRHKKFGDGVVTRVIDDHKVEVLFRDEARTLAQGMS